MADIRRIRVNVDVEKDILIAAIISDKFCREIRGMYRKEYFQLQYAPMIMDWIFAYFDQYDKAPDSNIQSIYNVEKEYLNEETSDLVELFLQSLSERYGNKNKLNVDYQVQETMDYFSRRRLELLFKKGKDLVDAGRIDDAEKLLCEDRTIKAEISDRFDPFCEKEIKKWDEENMENRLFRFPGKLGQLIGWIERNNFITFTAPEKRGKSFCMEECAMQCVKNKLVTVFFSLEMSKDQLKNRFYKDLTALVLKQDIEEYGNTLKFPVFDCRKNQDNSCDLTFRDNGIKLLADDNKPDFESYTGDYKVCTYCRKRKKYNNNYSSAYWFRRVKAEEITKDAVLKRAKKFRNMYKGYLRIKTYPAFSANSDDIKRELDNIEYTDNVKIDAVVIDYIDILGPEKGYEPGSRNEIDAKWKNFKNIAATRNCVVITADQSNKQTYKRNIELGDTSEDKRKNAHIDLKVAINQKVEKKIDEKEDGVMRFSVIAKRHGGFNPKKQVWVLNQLTLGQTLIDSEWKR